MENYVGKCKYCGYEVSVMAYSQKDADSEAEKTCGCNGAKKELRKAEFVSELETLVGSKAEERRFAPVSADVYEIIKKTGELMIDEAIRIAKFKVDGTNINLTIKNDKVEIARKYTHEESARI